MLDPVPQRVPRAAAQDRGVGVQDGFDRPIPLRVDAYLQPAGVELPHHGGQLIGREVHDPRAVGRNRVAAVDGCGAAAHPAVGPDLHRLGGQPRRAAPAQPGPK